jgi:phosphoglycerate dehydrogenase-like enzyme
VTVKIVILDEVDLSDEHRKRLDSLGEVTDYSEGPRDVEEVVARSADADLVILGWTALDDEVFRRLPRLQMISVWATGYD